MMLFRALMHQKQQSNETKTKKKLANKTSWMKREMNIENK
jgi:hypothetical protein